MSIESKNGLRPPHYLQPKISREMLSVGHFNILPAVEGIDYCMSLFNSDVSCIEFTAGDPLVLQDKDNNSNRNIKVSHNDNTYTLSQDKSHTTITFNGDINIIEAKEIDTRSINNNNYKLPHTGQYNFVTKYNQEDKKISDDLMEVENNNIGELLFTPADINNIEYHLQNQKVSISKLIEIISQNLAARLEISKENVPLFKSIKVKAGDNINLKNNLDVNTKLMIRYQFIPIENNKSNGKFGKLLFTVNIDGKKLFQVEAELSLLPHKMFDRISQR